MFRRFLNTHDYISIVTEEALDQLIRGNEERLAQAEEAAEQSVLEYLTNNYEIERELEFGKRLEPYNPQITYPAGAHFYDTDGQIVEALRTINGVKAPALSPYWEEYLELIEDESEVEQYTQRHNYKPGTIVRFGADQYFKCLEYNGPDFNNIRVPGVHAWESIEVEPWEANVDYAQWTVVSYDTGIKEIGVGYFALLVSDPKRNLTTNPMDSEDWGYIGAYDPTTHYELSPHEYVVYNNKVFYPIMSPNADVVEINSTVKYHDPRNPNIKKHLLRLAVYELHKLISPTNISNIRLADYETSILWLRDASHLKLNPGIPRKRACDKAPVTNFATATFQRSYDPWENMWHF